MNIGKRKPETVKPSHFSPLTILYDSATSESEEPVRMKTRQASRPKGSTAPALIEHEEGLTTFPDIGDIRVQENKEVTKEKEQDHEEAKTKKNKEHDENGDNDKEKENNNNDDKNGNEHDDDDDHDHDHGDDNGNNNENNDDGGDENDDSDNDFRHRGIRADLLALTAATSQKRSSKHGGMAMNKRESTDKNGTTTTTTTTITGENKPQSPKMEFKRGSLAALQLYHQQKLSAGNGTQGHSLQNMIKNRLVQTSGRSSNSNTNTNTSTETDSKIEGESKGESEHKDEKKPKTKTIQKPETLATLANVDVFVKKEESTGTPHSSSLILRNDSLGIVRTQISSQLTPNDEANERNEDMDLPSPPTTLTKNVALQTPQDYQSALQKMAKEIEIKTRSYDNQIIEQSFVGRDAVTWLHAKGYVRTRKSGLLMGRKMQALGYIRFAGKTGKDNDDSQHFEDKMNFFYTLQVDVECGPLPKIY
ncbi:hypothetical protein RFI_17157 [Reticulomyxa filosa]|uniref:DEP domain-containing protein n=1 Tax=Reticulomyxa filosa TaxID=46433 RepID=X6N1V7_RETFI|nr:hypothetical protein RFI_17157 [Reticulomyxa filosa]|eukprot:ETO20061.1 hypothetical protein RFI_17157 [Reticulomyxa filosa]